MAISPIELVFNQPDKEVERLNALINKYNNAPSISKLQLIDAFANQMLENYKNNPNTTRMEAIKWILQDHISQEIYQLPNVYTNSTKQKNLLGIQIVEPTLLNLERWKKSTGLIRAANYKNIDIFIVKVEHAQMNYLNNNFDNERINKHYFNTLTSLQKKVLSILLNDITPNNPKMTAKFEALLHQTNSELHEVSNKIGVIELLHAPRIPVLEDFAIIGSDVINPLVLYLANERKEMQLGAFSIRYLGGNNNANWLASNPESEERYVLRLEKAELPETDYVLINKAKSHPQLNIYIAFDYFYYPTDPIELAPNYPVSFNLAVSEFCQQGDILRYRRNLDNFSGGKNNFDAITNKVVEMTRQVAGIAYAFNKVGIPYMDIKSENFLIRDDGQIITADLKSLVRSNKHNHVKLDMIVTTFQSPEIIKAPDTKITSINAECFMVYLIGLMMYDLITTQEEPKPWVEHFYNGEELDFELPIFSTHQGREIAKMIRLAMDPEPAERPSLAQFIQNCNELHHELELDNPQQFSEI